MNALRKFSASIAISIAIAMIAASCVPAGGSPYPSISRPDLLDVMVDVGGYKLRIA